MTPTAMGSSALLDVETDDAGSCNEGSRTGGNAWQHRVAAQQEIQTGADSSGYMVAVE